MEIRGSLLSPLDAPEDPKVLFLGETLDIGRGGVCLLTDQQLRSDSVLRCELVLHDSSIGVPTLMQVRWSKKTLDKNAFRVGLQFLL